MIVETACQICTNTIILFAFLVFMWILYKCVLILFAIFCEKHNHTHTHRDLPASLLRAFKLLNLVINVRFFKKFPKGTNTRPTCTSFITFISGEYLLLTARDFVACNFAHFYCLRCAHIAQCSN